MTDRIDTAGDPVDRRLITLATTMAALEWIVVQGIAHILRTAPDPESLAAQWLAGAEQAGDTASFAGTDPATSDLASQMYRDTMIGFLLHARAIATGKPLEPADHERRYDRIGQGKP